jgi:hypothetical protein
MYSVRLQYFGKLNPYHAKNVAETFVKRISRQQCRAKEQYYRILEKYRITGLVLGNSKLRQFAFFPDKV